MELSSKEAAEFRIKRTYTASNGSVSYFYTFENDDLGSFELWSKENLPLEKGKQYRLVFIMSFYQGNQNVKLKECISIGK